MTEHDGRPPGSGDEPAEGFPAPVRPPEDQMGGTPLEPERESPLGVDEATAPDLPESRPSYLFFAVVSSIALVADVGSKAWAEIVLNKHPGTPTIVLIDRHLNLTLAYNKGGAWGMFQGAPEVLRKPFFYIVSLAAIAFIVSLFGRVSSRQRALKWGLPLVFGGALGNLADRVIRGSVVDFIDYRADWLQSMNAGIAKVWSSWGVTDHWP